MTHTGSLFVLQAGNMPITSLKGIGLSRAAVFEKQGLVTVRDVLEHYPRTYIDQTSSTKVAEAPLGEEVVIRARLLSEPRNFHARGLTITSARVADETGSLSVAWFNQPYMVRNLTAGEVYFFVGKIRMSRNQRQLTSPKVQKADAELPGILPIYPLGGSLTQVMVRKASAQALSLLPPEEDYLPVSYRQNHLTESEAYRQIHRPGSMESQEKARRRLSFDELFIQQMALLELRGTHSRAKGAVLFGREDLEKKLLEKLPFTLTGAQARALDEIREDLSSEKAMNRLVQGDVGSGKTAVAFLSMYQAYVSGYQSALMAPTEVLARQHFEAAKHLFEGTGMEIGLLTGSLGTAARKELYEKLRSGALHAVIGTHALISEKADYHRLGLVITDEQHRFGVRQRLKLFEKGETPNVLVMTATPIPRTLAMILYGDMDSSLIDEMPPGRKKVETFSVSRAYEKRLYDFMEKQVEKGHQVYVICGAVSEKEEEDEPADAGEKLRLIAAESYQAYLQKEVFPSLRVGLLHGQMKSAEKDAVMSAFAEGKIHILVATTVVEVGVNVPNATLMVVENAERFGLAQLHQLRGRVGRGSDESYCVLVSDSKQALTKERLGILTESTDGFYIAEKDLQLRGAGDIFGLRQHGLPDFKIADLYQDMDLLREAQSLARVIMEADPELSQLEHAGIRALLQDFWERAIIEKA